MKKKIIFLGLIILHFLSYSQIDTGYIVQDSIRIYHNTSCVINGWSGKKQLKKNYFQYCKNIIIQSWFKKSLKYSFQNNNLEYLTIFNRWKSVTIPESIKTSNVKGISMEKCKNDTIFRHAKNLKYLNYVGRLDKEVFKLDSLNDLTVRLRGDNANLLNLTNGNNYALKGLTIARRGYKLFELDSTLLYFKNLEEVMFNINPFKSTNSKILIQLKLLKDISSYYVDYRNIVIEKDMIEKLSKYNLYFVSCIFTRQQIELLKQYKNIKIN